ncbi:M50 family metallopeptidase, partial [Methanospirillum hungatei]|uniref:M50 family metallopeptidase n=1 Tax=Methanospirillum hungatei TaxID=2203 RepID=UPI0026EB4515
ACHYWELCIPLPGIHILFDIIDEKIGWILRSRLFPWIFGLICLLGLTYFLITEPLPSYRVLEGEDSQLITVLSVYLILITAAILHVFGHALACKGYGREIGDAGLLLYYGMPCLYIDTSDIWMADRRSRIIVSLAGPAVNLFIGSVCSLLVMGFPDSDASSLIWRVAFLSFVVALINLNPLLEFDGYYALADLLEVPDLRERAFSFLRTWGSNRTRLSREGWFFLIYGTASAVCTLAIVIVGMYFWTEHMTYLISELGKDRWEMDHVLATFAIVIVFVPFFAGMVISGARNIIQKIQHQSKNNGPAPTRNEQVYEKRALTRRISK